MWCIDNCSGWENTNLPVNWFVLNFIFTLLCCFRVFLNGNKVPIAEKLVLWQDHLQTPGLIMAQNIATPYHHLKMLIVPLPFYVSMQSWKGTCRKLLTDYACSTWKLQTKIPNGIILFLVNAKLSQSRTIVISHLTFADYFYEFFFVLHHFILILLQNIPIQVLTQCKILSRIMQPHLSENFTKFNARFYSQPQHMWRTKDLHQELQQVLWKWCQKTLMRTVCRVDIHLVLVLRHSPEVKHKFSFQVRKALDASIFLLIIRLHKIKLSLWSSPPSGGWGLKITRRWWRRKWKRGALDWLPLLVEFCRFLRT